MSSIRGAVISAGLSSADPEVKEQAGEARGLRSMRRAEVAALAEHMCLGVGDDVDQPLVLAPEPRMLRPPLTASTG